jgi:hypothetical protein
VCDQCELMMSAMECVEVASSCEEREIELEKVGDDPLSLSHRSASSPS